MITSPTISSAPPAHKSKDFWFLREAGMEYIRQLGGKIWTDHNIHDPGITILEVLCYAITEIGHRIQQPIPNLLNTPLQVGSDYPIFFPPHLVLPNCPLTPDDYRKLLIDVKIMDQEKVVRGVKNAFLFKAESSEQDFFCRLKLDPPNEPQATYLTYQENTVSGFETKPVVPNGLYTIQLEIQPQRLNDNYISLAAFPGQGILLPYWDQLEPQDIWMEQGSIESVSLSSMVNLTDDDHYAHLLDLTVQIKDSNLVLHTSTIQVKVRSLAYSLPSNLTGQLSPTSFIFKSLEHYKIQLEEIGLILQNVRSRLYAHRNLGEVVREYIGIRQQDIALCGDIELMPDAKPREVLTRILKAIHQFFSPDIPFHSLEEMLDQGYLLEDIFEGPLLTHGYIRQEDLINKQRRNAVFTSDLINILMDIPGIFAVHNFSISSYLNQNLLAENVRNCLTLEAGDFIRPKLDVARTIDCLNFRRNGLELSLEQVDQDSVSQAFEAYVNLRDAPLPPYDLVNFLLFPLPSLPGLEVPQLPEITPQEPPAYYSIQHDFPLTYGIGKEGLPPSATPARQTQALQLKGYLLFYEQFLANFLSQLVNLKDYFSLQGTVNRTYFYQTLAEVPGVDNLFQGYANYESQLATESEQEATFYDRRNRFLNHVLARFGEDFTDYSILMYQMLEQPEAATEVIEDKLTFLRELPAISACRARAFNYRKIIPKGVGQPPDYWNTTNVSGFQQRVSRKLGFHSYMRRDLSWNLLDAAHFPLLNNQAFEIRRHNANMKLTGITNSFLPNGSGEVAEKEEKIRILQWAMDYSHYVISPSQQNSIGPFHFVLKDANGVPMAESNPFFSYTDAQQGMNIFVQYLWRHQEQLDCEGFYLLEHILLRPTIRYPSPILTHRLLPVFNLYPDQQGKGYRVMDPYSFHVTVVFPSGWKRDFSINNAPHVELEGASRFRDPAFRQYAERVVREELPSHIYAHICWMDVDTSLPVVNRSLNGFQNAYKRWLSRFMQAASTEQQLVQAHNKFIEVMLDCKECCWQHITPPGPATGLVYRSGLRQLNLPFWGTRP